MAKTFVLCRDAAQVTAARVYYMPVAGGRADDYVFLAVGDDPRDGSCNRIVLSPGWKGDSDESTRAAWAWYRSVIEPRWADKVNRPVVAL